MNNLQKSQFGISSNVRITRRNEKTGKSSVIECSNRVTRTALQGILEFVFGTFSTDEFINNSYEDLSNGYKIGMYRYIPHYVSLGSNYSNRLVTVNDHSLSNELYDINNIHRFEIASRNKSSDPHLDYVKITFRAYVPSDALVSNPEDKETYIGEAGLFCTDMLFTESGKLHESSNSCWARVTFDKFAKERGEVVDILWTITITSVNAYSDDPALSVLQQMLYKDIEDNKELESGSNE